MHVVASFRDWVGHARFVAVWALLFGSAGVAIAQVPRQENVQGFRGSATQHRQADLMSLLSMDAVRQELGTNNDQYFAIRKLSDELFNARPYPPINGHRVDPQLLQDGALDVLDPRVNVMKLSPQQREAFLAQRRQIAKQRDEFARERLSGVLSREQMNRLFQVQLQVRGPEALADDDIARQLQLTDGQRRQIQDLATVGHQALFDLSRQLMKSRDSAASRTRVDELRQQIGDSIDAVLSPTQRTGFRLMQGEPFALARRPFESPRPLISDRPVAPRQLTPIKLPDNGRDPADNPPPAAKPAPPPAAPPADTKPPANPAAPDAPQ